MPDVFIADTTDTPSLVLERFPATLGDLSGMRNARIVCGIGVAVLRALQYVHLRGFIHNDVSIYNIGLRVGTLSDLEGVRSEDEWCRSVVLFDFGLALDTTRDGFVTGKWISGRRSHSNMSHHSSTRSMHRLPPRPYDDLESLFYVLSELLTGRVRWDRRSSKTDILCLKLAMRAFPCAPLKKFVDILNESSPDDIPNYEGLAQTLNEHALPAT